MCRLDREGFEILSDLLDSDELADLRGALAELPTDIKTADRKIGGIRNLLTICPRVRDLAKSQKILDLVDRKLAHGAFPVRSIFFDKTPDANWLVPWHQDLTIAVAEKRDVAGFGPWSVKNGVNHVQAPAELLERMLTLRIHLDDCDESNGALRVIPGSHRNGKLSSEGIRRLHHNSAGEACCVKRGGAVLMKPLLLHASSPAKTPHHRRVIHIEYAAVDLLGGLEWYEKLSHGK